MHKNLLSSEKTRCFIPKSKIPKYQKLEMLYVLRNKAALLIRRSSQHEANREQTYFEKTTKKSWTRD